MTAQQPTQLRNIQATISCAWIRGIFNESAPGTLEQSSSMINTCLEIIESVTGYYGGEVIQFTGKNVILLFPEHSDQTKKSSQPLEALLEIRDKITELSSEISLERPLELEAGVHVGPVLHGQVGTSSQKQPTVVGEVVDFAIGLQEMANRGQILAGPEVYKLHQKEFDFQSLEPILIKGKSDPVPIYKVLQRKKKEFVPTDQAGRSIYSAMVGREPEKRQLISAVIDLSKGKGGIIAISGAPGTGKSRLIGELRKENSTDKFLWFEGRAISNGHNLSYHPFAGILKSWAGIREEDSQLTAATKLKSEIGTIYSDGSDDIFPFIARFMGLTLSGAAGEKIAEIETSALDKLMLKAIRELLIKAASRKPFLIAIEDLHWADQSSLALLKSLVELSHSHPILFITVMRPGYPETSDPLIKFLHDHHSDHLVALEVSNLNQDHSQELIRNLVLSGDLPSSLISEVVDKTGGNPFFIEEVLRSLMDQHIIEFADNAFKFNASVGSINIPETINEVLLTRVGKLDEKTRNLLDTASVIGRNFYFKVLDEAADAIGEVSERLQYLKNMQFIQESGDEENLEFVFKHALAHQASYDSMMEKKRKSLHLKIAESIEKVFPERINEFYGTLAMHYIKAENYIKAEEYLMKAGEEAMQSAASSEAISYFEEAFKTYLKTSGDEPDPVRVTELYSKIGSAYQLGGKNEKAIEYFEKVLRHYGIAEPRTKIGQIKAFVSNFTSIFLYITIPGIRFRKEATDHEKWLLRVLYFNGKALYSYDSRRWFRQTVLTFNYFSRFTFSSNEYGQATLSAYSMLFNWTGISLSVARKILNLSGQKIELRPLYIQQEYYMFRKMHQFLEGDWRMDPTLEEMYTSALKTGDIFTLTVYLLFCGFISVELGLEEETVEILKKMKTAGEEFESDHMIAQYHRLNAVALFKFRKTGRIWEETTKGIDYTKETGHRGMLQIIYSMRLMNSVINDDPEGAGADMKEIEQLMPPLKKVKIWYSAYFLAKAYLLTEDFRRNPEDREIERNLFSICKSAIKQSRLVPNNLIESHRIMGNAQWMAGKKKKALTHYTLSLEAAEKVNGRLELSRTCFELGKRLSSNGVHHLVNGLSGQEYLEKARKLFTEMNLSNDLAELERFSNR